MSALPNDVATPASHARASKRRAAGVKLKLALAALIFASWAIAPIAAADQFSEYELKAGFLYHFALFTEWPADVGSTLNICVLGSDPFGGEIDKLVDRKVDGRRLSVTRLSSVDAIGSCQIVFVAHPHALLAARTIDAVRDRPILTVGEADGLAKQGFVINLVLVDDKIRFEINAEAAKRAKLVLSSKLLRLATALY